MENQNSKRKFFFPLFRDIGINSSIHQFWAENYWKKNYLERRWPDRKQRAMSNVWENNILLIKSKKFAHLIYQYTHKFPKNESFGLTSQIRRASVSISLNIIEGYSRFKIKPHINFLEIAFGSLKETQFLIDFCYEEKLFNKDEKEKLSELSEEISKMLYSKIKTLKQNPKSN